MQLLGDPQAWCIECAAPSPLAGHAINRPWGLDGGIHPTNGPASGEDTAPDSWLLVLLRTKNIAPDSLLAAG
ncbi:hypothetical protein NX80_021510 [Xanthomonas vasicola pv. arecae]|uniref:hypothetical protein n=1 Tax=Xanthomonas vasicola TaxID=56459 RepID=UPI000F855924|nr:hypothetical protein [Xanthomonas vasicola]AZR28606.1 hypothetical protein NX80_021510 [Xanthomonas vasicola pv. arecae]MBV7304270.1 hypothetical protein [Xanthomonas vasicola pv. vasculorum]MDO6934465.1 hypothetical protein [Xanthomonas vasicola]MDO6938128.1 hypothetical protein [Xanthomonas vasicola]